MPVTLRLPVGQIPAASIRLLNLHMINLVKPVIRLNVAPVRGIVLAVSVGLRRLYKVVSVFVPSNIMGRSRMVIMPHRLGSMPRLTLPARR